MPLDPSVAPLGGLSVSHQSCRLDISLTYLWRRQVCWALLYARDLLEFQLEKSKACALRNFHSNWEGTFLSDVGMSREESRAGCLIVTAPWTSSRALLRSVNDACDFLGTPVPVAQQWGVHLGSGDWGPMCWPSAAPSLRSSSGGGQRGRPDSPRG